MTEIGEIPEEWDTKKLSEVSECRREIVQPLKNKSESYVGLENITPGKIRISTFGNSNVLKSSKFKFYKSDILYGKLRPYLDKVAVAEQDGICSTDIIPIIGRQIDSYFLVYQLHSNLFLQFAISTISGTNHPRTSWEQISHFIIPCPPLLEQQKIAEILTTADRKIELIDREIQATEKLKRGLMQTLLTKGIGHTKFKMTEIGEMPEEWDCEPLKKLCEIYDNRRVPLNESERGQRNGSFPYCGANGVLDYIDDFLFDGSYVLLAEDGGLYGSYEKSAYLMKGKFWVNNHAHILKGIVGKLNDEFLINCLNFLDLGKYIVGSTRVKLNQEAMKSICIPYAALPEQQKIAEILTTADKKIELLNEKKKEAERLKKGLMQALLTGHVRVKIDSSRGEN